jgi:hypothetical protein
MKYKYLNNNSTYLVCVLEALLLIYFLLSLFDVIASCTTGSFGHSCALDGGTSRIRRFDESEDSCRCRCRSRRRDFRPFNVMPRTKNNDLLQQISA